MYRALGGQKVSFAEAAKTSIKPEHTVPPHLRGQYSGYIQLSQAIRAKGSKWRVWWAHR